MRNNRKFKRQVFYVINSVFLYFPLMARLWFVSNQSHPSRKRRDNVTYDQMSTFGNYLEQGKCDHHIVHWNIWRARKKIKQYKRIFGSRTLQIRKPNIYSIGSTNVSWTVLCNIHSLNMILCQINFLLYLMYFISISTYIQCLLLNM